MRNLGLRKTQKSIRCLLRVWADRDFIVVAGICRISLGNLFTVLRNVCTCLHARARWSNTVTYDFLIQRVDSGNDAGLNERHDVRIREIWTMLHSCFSRTNVPVASVRLVSRYLRFRSEHIRPRNLTVSDITSHYRDLVINYLGAPLI